MKKTYTLAALIIIGTIGVALAQSTGAAQQAAQGIQNLGGLVGTFNGYIVKSLATMFATLAMVAFFWGIVQFIWGVRSGQQQVITDGKKFMGWGLIALFVMFSVWGIIIFFQKIFGIDGNNTIVIPSIQLQSCTGSGCGSNTGNGSLPVGGNGTGNGSGGNFTDYNGCIAAGGSASSCSQLYPNQAPGGNGSATGGNFTDYNGCIAAGGSASSCSQLYPGGNGGASGSVDCTSFTDITTCSNNASCTWNPMDSTCR